MKFLKNQRFPLILACSISFLLFLLIPKPDSLSTQNEKIYHGTVSEIKETTQTHFEQRQYIQQNLQVSISENKKAISVSTEYQPENSPSIYEKGDAVLIGSIPNNGTEDTYYLIGYDRTSILLLLLAIFICLALLITKKQGVNALLSMGFSFSVIFFFILPLILDGMNPLLVSISGIFLIIPISFSLTHGLTHKTISAIIGTVISLITTGFLAALVIHAANITGITTEEVEVLFYSTNQTISLSGILLAGILIGALGIFDDVAISQASIVQQLKETSPKLSPSQVFTKAMNVGRDHIASVINTLVLVYTGASLSTLLLFLIYPRPLIVLLNSEIVVIQIVIALVGSIGLILTVPITTYASIYGIDYMKGKLTQKKKKS